MAESTQIAQEIGAKIRYLRLKRGMSQETLALNCDMNPAFLGHVERGMRCPTVNTLQRICNGLDITLTELILTQSGEEQTPDDPRNASVQHVLDVMSHLTPTQAERMAAIVENAYRLLDDENAELRDRPGPGMPGPYCAVHFHVTVMGDLHGRIWNPSLRCRGQVATARKEGGGRRVPRVNNVRPYGTDRSIAI